MISAPSRPICSARYAPNMEPALPSFCRSATPKPCSFISMRSAARVTAGAHAILILDQAGWHGAKDLKIPRNLSLLPLPPRAPELNPPRKYLAVHATELAVEPNLQILRRHRRSLLLRLEHPHRSALENHVHRTPRLGCRRSVNLRIGIRGLEIDDQREFGWQHNWKICRLYSAKNSTRVHTSLTIGVKNVRPIAY